MNILWSSNYSSQSGYSLQAQLFVPRLHAAGHRVTVFELSNGQRMPSRRDGIKILPVRLDPLGSDLMGQHYVESAAHCVITLTDTWALNRGVMEPLNWYPITPIDHRPVPPAVQDILQVARRPIAMSQYGLAQLRQVGFDPLYWPHAIDPAVWHPQDKARARQIAGVDMSTFFVSFVGVNDSSPSRKGIPEMLMAWQIFTSTHDDVLLYLHTHATGTLAANPSGGVDINRILRLFEINPDTIRTVDQYRYSTALPTSEMVTIANAADVLLLPTRGEGFGLPVLEYAATGTPAIVSNVAASPELCFDGWLLEGEPEWTIQNALVQKPGVQSIVEALEAAYDDHANPRRAAACIEGARAYHIDRVLSEYALPCLETVAAEVLESVAV